MTISSIQSALRSCSVGISSAAEAVSKAANSCFNGCCVRQSRYSVLTNEASSLPPSNSLIKSSFIRNALGLNLSRAELANDAKYSTSERDKLIENPFKLLAFLKRAKNTIISSKSDLKKEDLRSWAEMLLENKQTQLTEMYVLSPEIKELLEQISTYHSSNFIQTSILPFNSESPQTDIFKHQSMILEKILNPSLSLQEKTVLPEEIELQKAIFASLEEAALQEAMIQSLEEAALQEAMIQSLEEAALQEAII